MDNQKLIEDEKAVWLPDEPTEETVVTVEKKPEEIKISWETHEKGEKQ
jgi:hypothetical protein